MEVTSLFNRILPHSEQQIKGNDEDGIGDPAHGSPTGINRIKSTVRSNLNLPLRPVNSDRNWNEDIKKLLRNAYGQDYKIKVTLMGNLVLQWYNKFSFDDL
jgi:hypothetical protein